MPQVFQPHKVIYVKASSPHPANTLYRIAQGFEAWENEQVQVMKVQMVYNGRVNGRMSASYPTDSIDLLNVRYAEDLIMNNKGSNGKAHKIFIYTLEVKNKKDLNNLIEKTLDELHSELLDYYVPMTIISTEVDTVELIKENLYRVIFNVEASKSH